MGLRRLLSRGAPPMSPERAAHIARYDAASAPVIEALRADGLAIDRLPQLHAGELDDYSEHLPVLVEWLGRVSYPPVVESLARALTVPAARGTEAVPALIDALAVGAARRRAGAPGARQRDRVHGGRGGLRHGGVAGPRPGDRIGTVDADRLLRADEGEGRARPLDRGAALAPGGLRRPRPLRARATGPAEGDRGARPISSRSWSTRRTGCATTRGARSRSWGSPATGARPAAAVPTSGDASRSTRSGSAPAAVAHSAGSVLLGQNTPGSYPSGGSVPANRSQIRSRSAWSGATVATASTCTLSCSGSQYVRLTRASWRRCSIFGLLLVVAIQPTWSSQIGWRIRVRGAPSGPTVATVAHAIRAIRAWNSSAISANDSTRMAQPPGFVQIMCSAVPPMMYARAASSACLSRGERRLATTVAARTVVAVTQGLGGGVFLSMKKIKVMAVSAALSSALWLPAAAEAARSWR